MACFSAFFWSRKKEEGADPLTSASDNAPWFISGVEPYRILPPSQVITKQVYNNKQTYVTPNLFPSCDLWSDLKFSLNCENNSGLNSSGDCEKSQLGSDKNMSKKPINNENCDGIQRDETVFVECEKDFKCDLKTNEKVAPGVPTLPTYSKITGDIPLEQSGSLDSRHRKTGVFGITETGVVKNEDAENLLVPPPVSGYCSSTASGGSEDEFCEQKSTKVVRCESLDSAIVNSDEETATINSNWGEKIEEIDEIPYSRPVFSPYSPRRSIDHENVPSKTLIEAHTVPFPLDRKQSDCFSETSDIFNNDSRRQSCFTDDGEEISRYRYWRTPSVVVSDYSDDPMGLTLEDIEYIRNQNKENNNSSPDSSLHSSYSNLNLFGGFHEVASRKISDCSTCSISGDEDSEYSREPSPWRKIRNFVQWTPFFQTYKKQRYPWVQLAGHQGNFKAGPDQGTILKKLCLKEEKCFKVLMDDVLRPFVPEYKGLITSDDGESTFIQLQDLLSDFVSPCVMDCKIGVRTYLEEELAKAKEKPKLRKDMYEKMCQIDNSAPTDEEHKMKGVTKPRYMVWRETISSTATLGFRIEGIRKSDGTSSKDFKTIKTRDQVMKEFMEFTENFPHALPKYIQRLIAIKETLETSSFFRTHEVIGSSLLFVHDKYNANVWLIDFAKTLKLPEDVKITHKDKWKVGNHEDGYLIGLDNLISIFKSILEHYPVPVSPPLSLPDTPELENNT